MNLRNFASLVCSTLLLAAAPAGDPAPYANDFSQASPGKLSDAEFLVLAGRFEVKDVGGEKLLELAAHPADSFGVLFGPAVGPAGSVCARVWGATTGRRAPEFGVGCNDTGGYKLWLMPRQKLLAIRKADATVATAPYAAWTNGTWTHFRLTVGKAGEGAWRVQGKAWPAGGDEPAEWAVSYDDAAEPPAGRASVWGNPYSDEPIRFDDLRVMP